MVWCVVGVPVRVSSKYVVWLGGDPGVSGRVLVDVYLPWCRAPLRLEGRVGVSRVERGVVHRLVLPVWLWPTWELLRARGLEARFCVVGASPRRGHYVPRREEVAEALGSMEGGFEG